MSDPVIDEAVEMIRQIESPEGLDPTLRRCFQFNDQRGQPGGRIYVRWFDGISDEQKAALNSDFYQENERRKKAGLRTSGTVFWMPLRQVETNNGTGAGSSGAMEKMGGGSTPGDWKLWMRWPEHDFRGKTLQQVWDADPRLFLKLARWAKRKQDLEPMHRACELFMAQPQIAALVVELDREAKKRGMARARSRQIDRQFQDRQTEWGIK